MKSLTILLFIILSACGVKESAQESGIEGPQGFAVTGLVDELIPLQTKTWNWDCNVASGGSCEYRYLINTTPTHTFTAEAFNAAPLTDSQLVGDAVYYLHIQAKDDFTFVETENSLSVSVIIDNTAPTDPTIGTVGATFTADSSQAPNVTWNVSTDINGVDHYEMALGTAPGTDDTVAWADIGNVTAFQFTGLTLIDGIQYYPSIRAHDQATNISGVHQNFGDFCSDTTAPLDPGNLNLVGQPYLTNSPQLTWDATTDACSGVQFYEVALGTTTGGDEVIAWTNVGTNLNHQFVTIVPELDVGTNYFLSVRATDNVGITGNAISSIAWQVPAGVNVTGVANDLTPTQAKVWNWSCDNLPCDYRHVIDTNPTYDFNGEAFGATTTDSQLIGDGVYYLHIQAKTQSNSDVSNTENISVIIDNTAPTDPTLMVLGQAYTTDNTSSPGLSWSASTDLNSIFDYEVGIGTTAGAVDTKAFTSDGNDLTATAIGLTLVEGQSYFATTRALDEAGNISNQLNSTAFCYDNTAPNVLVSVSAPADASLAQSPSHTWLTATDACSGVDYYELAIGTTAGADDVVAWNNIGNVLAHQETGLSLAGGTNYFTSVRVTDLAGFTSAHTTSLAWQAGNPYVTGITPPSDTTYIIGDDLDFVVNFDEDVDISNTPRIEITLTSGTVYADYLSGTGTSAITFRYTVMAADNDGDGVVLVTPIDLNTTGTVNASTGGAPADLNYTLPATASILIDGSVPTISSTTPPANSTYGVGDDLDFVINWSENVDITNTPRIEITLGSGTVYADYLSGTGTNATTFRYTVAASDEDVDGIVVVSPLDLNTTGTIKDTSGNDGDLTHTPPATGSILVDGTIPIISNVTPPANATYIVGQDLDFTVNYSENVTITNTPRIQVTLDSGTVYADYNSGSGSTAIVFRYTVVASDVDVNGIAAISPLDLNTTGTITDAVNDADLVFTPPVTASILVDGDVPSISSITPPANATYAIGQNLDFIVNWDENVDITNTPRIEVTLDSGTVYADYLSGSGSSAITFRYTVIASDSDANGITVVSPLDLNTTGIITDSSGNIADLTHTPPATSSILIDGSVPSITSVTPPANATYGIGDDVDFIVNWDENVDITNTPRIEITLASGTVYANYLSGTGTNATTFRYTVAAAEIDFDGIVLISPVDLNTTGLIQDASLNNADLSFTLPNTTAVLIDGIAPGITGIIPPADNTYIVGQELDFIVNFDEVVTVTNTPRIEITLATGTVYADYLSGTGSSALTFRYTVAVSEEDSNGVDIVSPLDLNTTGAIEDGGTNPSNLTFAPPLTTGVFIDGIVPTITSVTPPVNTTYNFGQNLDFVVNFDENVDITNTPRIEITLASGTVYADYNSGTGTNAITFRYTIGSGDEDADGIILVSPLDLNATGIIADANTNNAALTYTLPNTAAVLVDGVGPTITSVTPPANATYIPGQDLEFVVNFDDNVDVANIPRIEITFDSGTVHADYASGTGTNAITFTYTVQLGDEDTDGIAITSPVDLNTTGTLQDGTGNDAALSYTPPAMGSVLVSGVGPNITSVTSPAATTYTLGQNIDFTVNWDKNVTVAGSPRIAITLTTGTVYAVYNSGTGTAATVFRYTVAASEEDLDGVALVSPMDLDSGTIKDVATNDATLTFILPATGGIDVDALAPTLTLATPAGINQSNETSYLVQGTCSESGSTINGTVNIIPFSATCSAGAWIGSTVNASILADGGYTVSATVTDSNGNTSSPPVTDSVTKDTVTSLPVIAYLTPSVGFGNAGSIIFRVSAINLGDDIHVYDDSGCSNEVVMVTSAGTSHDISVTNAGEGTYLYYFNVWDGGNWSGCVGPKSFIEDQTSPGAPVSFALVEPLDGTQSNDATPEFTGTISVAENGATVSVHWDSGCTVGKHVGDGIVSGGAFSILGTMPVDGSATGVNSFFVKITDQAGNASSCNATGESYELLGTGIASLPKLAMVGSNSNTYVISLEDSNEIFHEVAGVPTSLGIFQTGDIVPTFTVNQGDKITSDGACYAITEGYGTAGWASEAYAGTAFTTFISRYGQFNPNIYIASVEGSAFVELKQNNVTIDFATVAKDTVHLFNSNLTNNQAVTITSDKKINVYFVSKSSGGGTYERDARVLTPAATSVIGFQGYITAAYDGTTGTSYQQDNQVHAFSIDVDQYDYPERTITGQARYAQITIADKPVSVTQIADANGINAAPTLPLTMISTNYGIARSGDYASFIAPNSGTVEVFNPAGVSQGVFNLTRNGTAHANAPYAYKYDPGTIAAGTTFVCSTPCYAMYDDDGPGADRDETLMIGFTP